MPGSALYYACRRLPEQPRSVLIVLHALAAELAGVGSTALSPDIAFARLRWWQEELLRLPGPAAQHPISRALRPHLERSGLDPAELLPLIGPRIEDLERPRPADQAALVRLAARTGGHLYRLAVRIDRGEASDGELDWGERLGTGCALVDMLRDVGADARSGRIRLPVEALQQHEVRVQELLEQSITPGDQRFTALIRAQCTLARDYLYRLAPDAKTQGESSGQARRAGVPSGLSQLGALKQALLDEISAAPGDVLLGQIALTPVRMLWITWRNRAARRL